MLKTRSARALTCGALFAALLTFQAPADAQWTFIRGDSNGDGGVNIADAVFSLNYLFSQGPGPCLDAIDANDDGNLDIADPIFTLDVLFAGTGATHPAPSPTCGEDPTTDAIDCVGPLAGCPAVPSGCTDNIDCGPGEFCQKVTGDCGGTGTCEATPFICPAIFDPVCGCDGLTYSNECVAFSSGVSVDTTGQCPVAGCTDNAGCGVGEFCQKATGDCGGTGSCETVPFICPLIFAPVCGCDGNTYDNECVAWSNSVSVDTTGQCVVAGCVDNSACPVGEFCQKALGNCNGTGTCAAIPFICTAIFAPVCGCDGNTYSNECVGWSNGVSADFNGMCP